MFDVLILVLDKFIVNRPRVESVTLTWDTGSGADHPAPRLTHGKRILWAEAGDDWPI
jgi:hypothetical protein